MPKQSDIEQFGLAGPKMNWPQRHCIITVDFEAIRAEMIDLWSDAMGDWASTARRMSVGCSFFVALEDVIQLRAANVPGIARFDAAFRALEAAGTRLYPHNHRLFHPRTGLPVERKGADPSSHGYRKRLSMSFDVVRRHGHDVADWLQTLHDLYRDWVGMIGCTYPRVRAFRAGGWDYGTTRDEVAAYVDALAAAAFHIDTSACRGDYGAATWRVGLPFRENVFRLANGLLEIAPCWSCDIGQTIGPAPHPGELAALLQDARPYRRGGGVFVVVLHFDHLFHTWEGGRVLPFRIRDLTIVRRRIKRAFRLLRLLAATCRLEFTTFDNLVDLA